MQKGDIILIELTGRELESNKVFETTSEETAKKEGFFSKQASYKPTPVVVGKSRLIQGLEEALSQMKEGEQRKLVLEPEKAFGERRPDLIGIVQLKEFTNRKIAPFPGLVIDINGSAGRVQSISGGRVRVDFNSDLAGKTVEYEIKIVKKLENSLEKAKAILEKLLNLKEEIQATENNGELIVELPEEVRKMKHLDILKNVLEQEIKESIPEIKKIEFKGEPIATEQEHEHVHEHSHEHHEHEH